jgi:hypothetical protein
VFGTVSPTAKTVESDNKTVTLTFSGSDAEQTGATFTVAPITLKSDVTKKTLAYAKVFSYTDTVAPAIKSITAETNGTSAGSATIKFTEAVAAGSAIKINGEYVGQTTATNEKTVTGTFATDKTHTVTIVNLSDQAATANTVALVTSTFTVTVDKVAPVATVSAKNDKQILITFSKKMKETGADSVVANNAGIKLVDATTLTVVTTASITAAVADTDSKQYLLQVSQDPFASVSTKSYYVQIPADIQDYLGNKTAAANLTVSLAKDVVKPAATGLTSVLNAAGKTTALKVTFSEDLANTTAASIASITDADGVLVSSASFPGGLGTATVADKAATYTLTTPTALTGTYTFAFGAGLVTDASFAANTSAAFSYTVNFGAAAAAGTTFEVSTVTNTTSSTTKVIEVEFAEAVLGGAVAGSATDVANYSINGSALPVGTTITLNSDKDIATITIPDGGFATSETYAVFQISGVKAKSGKTLKAYTGTQAIVDTQDPKVVSARLLANDKIELTYDSNVLPGTASASNFVLKAGDTTLTTTISAAQQSSAIDGYAKKLVLTLGTAITNTTDALTIKTVAGGVVDTSNNSNPQAADITVTIAR